VGGGGRNVHEPVGGRGGKRNFNQLGREFFSSMTIIFLGKWDELGGKREHPQRKGVKRGRQLLRQESFSVEFGGKGIADGKGSYFY